MATTRFTRAQLLSFEGAPVDDLIGADVRLLFVGINPGLWTAAVNAHFARRGNRFWPALLQAGILPRLVDPSDGMSDEDRDLVLDAGIGITNLVPEASARADELTRLQLADGARRLMDVVAATKPLVVAMLGVTAYRQAFGLRSTQRGRQVEGIAGAELWVLANPSGLNAHETVASLATAYRQAAVAAGLEVTAVAEKLPSPDRADAPYSTRDTEETEFDMANKSQDSKKTPLKQGKSLKEKRSDKATKKENKGGYSGK